MSNLTRFHCVMWSACSLLSLVRGVSVGVWVFTEQLRGVSNRCGVALSSDRGGYLRMICRGDKREQLSGRAELMQKNVDCVKRDFRYDYQIDIMKWNEKSTSVYLGNANIEVRPVTDRKLPITASVCIIPRLSFILLDWLLLKKTQRNSTLRRYILQVCWKYVMCKWNTFHPKRQKWKDKCRFNVRQTGFPWL